MAPINGLEVLRRLRETASANGSIFVMLSGIGNLKALNEGYQLGALTFFIKPIDSEDLVRFVSTTPRLKWKKTGEGYMLSLAQPETHLSNVISAGSQGEQFPQRIMAISA